MGADMILRTFYLPAGTGVGLAAAKACASRLCRQATAADVGLLLEYGWIEDTTADQQTDDPADDPADDPTDDPTEDPAGPAASTQTLRRRAETRLHHLLDRFADSLSGRDVQRERWGPDEPGVDVYTTGGLSYGEGPTDSFDAWDIVMDGGRFPAGWTDQIGAAARLLHPWGEGPAAMTLTLRAWH